MPAKIKCAVIGVGKMGINHVRVYARLKGANLVAVSEVNVELGKKVAHDYSVSHYSSYEDMIRLEQPKIVSICVPTSYHYEVASYCLKKKINVLLEKPIATNYNEGKKLVALAKRMKVSFLVGHIERFNPAVQKVKQLISQGKLGRITSIIARRVGGFPYQIRDANIMVDLAIHDIDVVNYLLDEFPQNISVNKSRIHIRTREDAVEYFLQYKTVSAYIQSNWITPVKIRSLLITGSEGYLELNYITQEVKFFQSRYDKFKEETKDFSDFVLKFGTSKEEIVSVQKKEPLNEEITYFLRAVKKEQNLNSKFAVDALKVALA